MAIKITTDAIVRVVKPSFKQFSLDELNDHVEGWIEPLKIGPIWVMYKEKAKEAGEPFNQVASFFFEVAMYGTVLVVPPQQMPTEWDIMDENDYRFSADQVESGFLSALQQALVYNRVFGAPSPEEITGLSKEEWTYKPTDEVDDSTIDFFRKAYESIVTAKIEKNNDILFEDESVIVRVLDNQDRLKTIQQMIDLFVQEEEYEKCAKLLEVKEKIS